jgi:hypothetical protein
MNNMRSIWIALQVFVCVALFASDYKIKQVPVLPIESYPARTTVGGVTIAADPYAADERSLTAFDIKDLNSRGYFPVHVIIQNNSSVFLTFRVRNVLLITRQGQQLYATPASLVVEDLGKTGKSKRSSSADSKEPSSSRQSGSAFDDFTGKELTNRSLDPGKVSDGFLFFFTPNPKKNPLIGGTLYIPKLEEEGTRKALGPFPIPLDPAIPASP